MKRIFSIRGGGIRGIIPACCLLELEKQTGKLTREVIDFIGGTSTGALLSAAIAAGVPAADSLDVYLEQGPKIFSPANSILRYANLVAKGAMFDNTALYKVVMQTLGAKAGMTLNDCPIGVMITAASQDKHCWYFTQDRPTNKKTTGTAPLVDSAVASACATTYHAPWRIPGFGYFADGGTVSLADPVYQTCAEAFAGEKCYGEIAPKDAVVVSLGTGFYKPPTMPDPPSGVINEINWVTGSLVDSSETLAQQAADRQWPGLIHVLDTPLWADVDEADVSAIPQLLSVAQKFAATIDWKTLLQL